MDHADGPALGCKLAPKIPPGTVLHDVKQKKWVVGKPIGSGAFGDIYLARYADREEEEYVVKVEPHSNGPLFVEVNAFLRLGLEQHRADWVPRNGKPQGWVGIPQYHGSGSFDIGKERLRFLVLSRFGSDIAKFFDAGEKPLPLTTALNISIQILESLEFIHSKGYTHNDIKAQNILLGFGQDKETIYLVDLGIACKYKDGMGFHKSSEPDERKAHEGTLEYVSRDTHTGVHSRRSDLESLGYNMVHWITGYLPWMDNTDPEYVQSQKIGHMFNIPGFLEKCFKPNKPPKVVENFLVYVGSLEFEECPDYSKLRKLLIQAMKAQGVDPYSPLVFSNKKKPVREESSDEEDFPQEETRATRSQDEEERFAPWSWEQVLAQDPESIIRQASRSSEQDENEANSERTAAFQQEQMSILSNPTPEMQRIMIAKELQEKMRESLSWKEQLQEFNQRNAAQKEKFANMDLEPRENTPAMEAVIQMRAQRLAAGICTPITPEPSDDENDTEIGTVVKAKRRSTRSSGTVSPADVSMSSTRTTRSRSITPTEMSPMSNRATRMSTRSSGRTTPTSKSSSRASTPQPVSCVTEYSTRKSSRASTPGTRSGSTTPDIFRGQGTRSRSASSEYDLTDSSGRVTRSKVDGQQESTDFKLPSVFRVTCSLCGKRMLKDSLVRHMEKKHPMPDNDPEQPVTRSGRIRKHSFTVQEDITEEDPSETGGEGQEPTEKISCPMCFVRIPKLKFEAHFDDLHSPARKITRKQFQDVINTEDVITVHASTDSPCKIFNINSPSKLSQQEEDEAQNDFKKVLSF